MSCSRFDHLHDHEDRADRADRAHDPPPPPQPGGRLPFPLPGAPERLARDRAVDLRHVLLEMTLDFDTRSIDGIATHRLAPLRPGVAAFTLDAVEMDVKRVALGGKPVEFRHDGRKLSIRLPEPLREGREVKLAIEYSCTPRRGFYFIVPDESDPSRVAHGWSQGQDEDSRHWWPVFDQPNEKMTSEMIARVPKGFAAISNGKLVSQKDRGRHSTWHWSQEIPHVPYLVTLVAGPFEKLEQKGPVPMTTWFLPGREQDARRCVKDTPRMLKAFGDYTGVPYPYAKYDQVFVQDFIFGGMENTSATTLTDLVLHDRRAAIDYTCEDLISHELAHQWWGDLVTCRDWSQAWLNEGFATWFEVVWKEQSKGPDEGWALRAELRDEYFDEDKEYRRPIVFRAFHDPIELFDAHLYQKGACVLEMLRRELGDELMRRSLKLYLTTHRGGSVETDDLRKAIERATGRNLEKFFGQWVESPGYPELEITASWNEERRQVQVCIEQQQAPAGGTPEAFEIPVELRFLMGEGEGEGEGKGKGEGDGATAQWAEGHARMTQRRQSFAFPLPAEPRAIVFDPDDAILKTVSFDQPIAALEAIATGAPSVGPRAEACASLGKNGSSRAIACLSRVLSSGDFWGVRAAAARALGVARGEAAGEALLARLSDEHPKVRRAVVHALGKFRDARAFHALQDVLENGDESYFVEAEAAISIGKTQRLDALRVLQEALATKAPGWNETVRCGVLHGLGHSPHEQRDEAIAAVIPWTEAGRFVRCRIAAIQALARLGENHPRALERLERLTEDGEFRVILAAAVALAKIGARRSKAALAHLDETALDGRIKRAARQALRRIGEREPALSRAMHADFDALASETKKLRDRLERLESRLGAEPTA